MSGEQLTLVFDQPVTATPPPEEAAPESEPDELEERAYAWIEGNRETYEAFVRAAHRLRAKNRRRVGIKRIVEEMRDDPDISPTRPDGWKINNSYVTYMGRKLRKDDPSFVPYIEIRKLAKERG